MSTVNGFGTGLRGWNHQADGTAFATSWVLLSYLPILPLRRYRVRVWTDFGRESFVPPAAANGRFAFGLSWTEPIEILERVPFSWREAVLTYLRAYELVPALCLWPFGVFLLVMAVRCQLGAEPGARLPRGWGEAVAVATAANALFVLLCAAQRMPGYPGARSKVRGE